MLAMKKLVSVVGTVVLLGTGCSTMGNRAMQTHHDGKEMQHGQCKMGHMMQRMDANGDRMLSREEFMKAHEAMFDRMKGPNGMIALDNMPMQCKGMMGHDQMKGHGQSMPGHGQVEKGTK